MPFARTTTNLRAYYQQQPAVIEDIIANFAKTPMMNKYFRNKAGLVYKAPTVKFSNHNWRENPLAFCRDQYNEQLLYPLILMCNNLGSIYEFIPDNLPNGIIAPDQNVIARIAAYPSI